MIVSTNLYYITPIQPYLVYLTLLKKSLPYINRKKGVEGLLNDIPEISLNYQPVSVNQRKAKSLAPSKATPFQLFQLFITPRHCRLIAKHTNQKAQDLKRGDQTHKACWSKSAVVKGMIYQTSYWAEFSTAKRID